ncbi:MAG: hypothetical protein QME96_14165 [Myxococcota bacterium]|nr:hypothetical protein [Myxococcota bacterium]
MRYATTKELAALVALALGLTAGTGCEDDPCRIERDCPAGHWCVQGRCVPANDADADPDDTAPDADVDADPDDAVGPDGDADADGDRPVICGDGVCDRPAERWETCAADCPPTTCGDGVCEPPETCECIDCPACPVVCGDGFTAPGEECDDGRNGDPDDGCTDDCTFSCHLDSDCPDDGDVCTRPICDSLHVCDTLPDGDGASCGTGDICTGPGTCLAGICIYSGPIDCDDGEACTTDTCDPVGGVGCVHTELAAGTVCDDGLFCITGDRCRLGLDGLMHCHGELGASPCVDTDPCTIDLCDEETDSCSYEPPTYRAVECGAEMLGNTAFGPNDFSSIVCPGGMRPAAGADAVQQVVVTGSGLLTVTLDTAASDPETRLFILSNPCSMTSCLADGRPTVSASVTPGTYYIVVDTSVDGGAYAYVVTCP